MERILEIWELLKSNEFLESGLEKVRYSPNITANIFLGIKYPEQQRVFIITGSLEYFKIASANTSIRLDRIFDKDFPDRSSLSLILIDDSLKDIFDVLIYDIIQEISNIDDDRVISKVFMNRLEKWKSLFEKAPLEGLSPEEQRGLYGEICFLRKWINKSADFQRCVQSWLGPEMELRDFQFGGWAVEVKTTHGNNHQKIHISSERQLDTSNLKTLILYHVSLESQLQHGETLNQAISSVVKLLSIDMIAQVQFRSKILQGGYFFQHSSKYEETGYQIRQETFYNIRDNFPRIGETDIRAGVGDVKYSIILSEHSEYSIPESFVFEIIS